MDDGGIVSIYSEDELRTTSNGMDVMKRNYITR